MNRGVEVERVGRCMCPRNVRQPPPHLLKSSASSKAALPVPWSCWKRAITPKLPAPLPLLLLLLPAEEVLLLLLLLLLLLTAGSGSTVQDRREGEEAAEGCGCVGCKAVRGQRGAEGRQDRCASCG